MKTDTKQVSGFNMNQLIMLAIGVFVVGFLTAILAAILAEVYDSVTYSEAKDVINETLVAIQTIPEWLGIIIIVGIAVVLLSMIFLIVILAKRFNQ